MFMFRSSAYVHSTTILTLHWGYIVLAIRLVVDSNCLLYLLLQIIDSALVRAAHSSRSS
jgi:hypothetical protein